MLGIVETFAETLDMRTQKTQSQTGNYSTRARISREHFTLVHHCCSLSHSVVKAQQSWDTEGRFKQTRRLQKQICHIRWDFWYRAKKMWWRQTSGEETTEKNFSEVLYWKDVRCRKEGGRRGEGWLQRMMMMKMMSSVSPAWPLPGPAFPQTPGNPHHRVQRRTAEPLAPWSTEAALRWLCPHPVHTFHSCLYSSCDFIYNTHFMSSH